MNDNERAKMIDRIAAWRHTIPEVAAAVSGMLVRGGVSFMAHLPDDDLAELHDACESMADLTDGGFFQ